VTIEERWERFSDEELIFLHLGIICLPKEVQMSCMSYQQPFRELQRRHERGIDHPFWFSELLAKYPQLEKQMNNWFKDRVYRGLLKTLF